MKIVYFEVSILKRLRPWGRLNL